MGLTVHTEEKTQAAQLMADPTIQYVSLVGHAANREPFRVVKNDTGGDKKMAGAKVQRMIAPAGSDVIAILKDEGIEFDGSVSVELKSTVEGFDIYTQSGVEKFDSTSLRLVALTKSEKPVMAVIGSLKPEHKTDKTLTVKSDLKSPLYDTVVDVSVENSYYGMYISTTTAADALDRESWNLYRGIDSIASAAGMDGKARLKAMLSMVDGFKNFISTLMAFIEESTTSTTTKSEAGSTISTEPFSMPILKQIMAAVAVNKEEDMGLTAEEITAIATKSALEAVKAFKSEEKKNEDAALEATKFETLTKEKADLEAKLVEAEGKLAEVTTQKADLEAKIASMDLTPETTQAGETTHKSEPETKKAEPVVIGCFKSDLSPFNAMFAPKG